MYICINKNKKIKKSIKYIKRGNKVFYIYNKKQTIKNKKNYEKDNDRRTTIN